MEFQEFPKISRLTRDDEPKSKPRTSLGDAQEHATAMEAVPQLKRGQVWCYECGHTEKVNSGTALAHGWPKHCGYTMGIDSPEERAALSLSAGAGKDRS